MEQNRVCAVMVSYHPDEEIIEHLLEVCAQVPDVIVVDNGSPQWELSLLSDASARMGFTLLENWENLGTAAALNRGIEYARERQFTWVMLFDQESAITPGFVPKMLRCATEGPDAKSVAFIAPAYQDARSGTLLASPTRDDMGLEAAPLSGSLIPTEIFDVAGLLAEELFIEGVDQEFSLRVRHLGLRIEQCAGAVLMHSSGTPTYHKLSWSKPFHAANSSPVRRYYQARNRVLLYIRYGRVFRGFCLRQIFTCASDLIQILGVEDDKWNKCVYLLRGLRDGVRGKTGKLVEDRG